MKCNARSLSLCSLGFGLLATGALALAVSTDYWIYTFERQTIYLDPNEMHRGPDGGGTEGPTAPPGTEGMETELDTGLDTGGYGGDLPMANMSNYDTDCNDELEDCGPPLGPFFMNVRLHAGLWRSCMIYDDGKCMVLFSLYIFLDINLN